MIPLKIKIALQNSFKCLQEADWAWLRAGATSRLCPHEASQVLRSKAESGRESWRAADLLQPGPVSLDDSVIVTESDRRALFLASPVIQAQNVWKYGKIVRRDKQWRHLLAGRQSSLASPPLEKLLQKLLHFMESILFSRKHLLRISLS